MYCYCLYPTTDYLQFVSNTMAKLKHFINAIHVEEVIDKTINKPNWINWIKLFLFSVFFFSIKANKNPLSLILLLIYSSTIKRNHIKLSFRFMLIYEDLVIVFLFIFSAFYIIISYLFNVPKKKLNKTLDKFPYRTTNERERYLNWKW